MRNLAVLSCRQDVKLIPSVETQRLTWRIHHEELHAFTRHLYDRHLLDRHFGMPDRIAACVNRYATFRQVQLLLCRHGLRRIVKHLIAQGH